MSSNRARFRYGHTSTVDITKPNKGRANVGADLSRSRNMLWINGIQLSELAGEYNNFSTTEDVKNLFRKQFLNSFTGDLESAVEYLMKTFHQGGLMFPVSTPIANSCKNKKGEEVVTVKSTGLTKEVYIQSLPDGLRIQEFCSFSTFFLNENGPLKDANKTYKEEVAYLALPEGKDSFIDAQATLRIKFKNAEEASFAVESNLMEIHHPGLKRELDHRTLSQRIFDFLLGIFFNWVPDTIFKKKTKSPNSSDCDSSSLDNDSERSYFCS